MCFWLLCKSVRVGLCLISLWRCLRCVLNIDLIQSTEADYELVPVEAYGLAMLKGMGWKQGEGIGRTFKQ